MSIIHVEDKKQLQRQAILDAARVHFTRFGYRRAVIDDIVREVGIAKGTFYLYFKSKDQLFLELVHQLHHEMLARFQTLFEQEMSVAERLRVLIEASFQAFEDYPLMTRILADDPEFRIVTKLMEQPAAQQEMQEAIEHLQCLLKTGIDNGELREDLDLQTVPLVLGMLKFLHHYMSLAAMHGVGRQQFIGGIVDLALNGLLRR
ncbi:MAG: TetR/AcrR family transcriptional regulator [Planctomycetaceae bacterium]|nr:TetR/AcrR family transcriptional regulator [Planctomycetaceae bacterium]